MVKTPFQGRVQASAYATEGYPSYFAVNAQTGEMRWAKAVAFSHQGLTATKKASPKDWP
jgi:hypothetical protein